MAWSGLALLLGRSLGWDPRSLALQSQLCHCFTWWPWQVTSSLPAVKFLWLGGACGVSATAITACTGAVAGAGQARCRNVLGLRRLPARQPRGMCWKRFCSCACSGFKMLRPPGSVHRPAGWKGGGAGQRATVSAPCRAPLPPSDCQAWGVFLEAPGVGAPGLSKVLVWLVLVPS